MAAPVVWKCERVHPHFGASGPRRPKSLGAAAKKLDTDLASLWWLAYKEAKSTLNEPPAVKP
jgi:hypothetical protein